MALFRHCILATCLIGLCLSSFARGEESGVVLIADPEMRSAVFARSVVLVTPHGDGGAFGVILNQPIPVEPTSLYPDDALLQKLTVVYFGGPVNPTTLVFLFRAGEPPEHAVHLFADVYFSSDREVLAEQLKRPREQSRLQVYTGYAGWAPGQLQMEIMHGDWSTMEADEELLFDTERDSIWEQLNAAEIPTSI